MTPTEKALELFHYFRNLLFSLSLDNSVLNDLAKKCAIRSVLEVDTAIDFDWMEIQNLDREHAFWNEVESHLNTIK